MVLVEIKIAHKNQTLMREGHVWKLKLKGVALSADP